MSIKETLSSNIVGHWDFRLGTLVDKSTAGNNGAFGSTPYWRNGSNGQGIQLDGVADYIDVGATSQTIKSIYIRFKPKSITSTTDYLIDLNGTDYITVVNGTVTVNGFAAATTAIYSNGVLKSTVLSDNNNSVLITSDTGFAATDLDIGRLEGTGFADVFIEEVILFDNQLTSLQYSQLYAESIEEGTVQGFPKDNFEVPSLMAFGEFQQDSIWTKGTGWTIANGKASSDGTQVAVSDLTQSLGVVGYVYTVEYSISGYSAGNVTGLAGDATGTARSANGVYTDVLVSTTDADLGVQADSTFVGDVDYVRISEGSKLVYRNDFRDDVVTVTALGSGDVGGFHLETGTWKITDDGTDKWLEAAGGGRIYIKSLTAYGTWEFSLYKALDGNSISLQFLADVIGPSWATGQDGYRLLMGADEKIYFRESINGSNETKFSTAGSYFAIATKYTCRITRSLTGLFTFYIKGGVFTDWTVVDLTGGTGSNPQTDNTTKISKYLVIDAGTGDKITNIKIWHGVLTPADMA